MEETKFSTVYNAFLSKCTDDMYLELTPQDTLKDLQQLLINSISDFEFPRVNLFDYTIETIIIPENEITKDDFFIGVVWDEVEKPLEIPNVLIDKSRFNCSLTQEEINILALLMKQHWVQRQVASVENTRMKYSNSDFKFTSQANHLSKLLDLLKESQREAFHMQRLYKRRELDENGRYRSTWYQFGKND